MQMEVSHDCGCDVGSSTILAYGNAELPSAVQRRHRQHNQDGEKMTRDCRKVIDGHREAIGSRDIEAASSLAIADSRLLR